LDINGLLAFIGFAALIKAVAVILYLRFGER